MTKRARVLTGTVGVLLALLLAAALFLRYQIRKSFPVDSGLLSVPGLDSAVTVSRDPYGVPVVDARNEHDLMFATGFVHAQDRLWQMDLVRHAGEGRLSELFGQSTVPFDRMFRIVGIRRTAEAIAATMSPASLERLQWYADGVNACIATAGGDLPVEFDLLGYRPEPWTPVHSILVGRLMAWELNLSWWTDITYGLVADKVGPLRALDLMPADPPEVPPAVPAGEWRAYASLGRSYLHVARSYAERFGRASVMGGSNAWVIGRGRSSSGAVILANDTHLQLESPSRWYEIQMQMPGIRVRGMSIAGVPAVVCGRNGSLAWGVTNVMADDADFYAEQLDSTGGTSYAYGATWRPIRELREEISVLGDSAVPLTIRMTHHGPIISDVDYPLKRAQVPYVVSMRWTGNEQDDQFGAITAINRATNWKEFIAGVHEFAVPGQNFVYGDSAGNIGYWCGAKIPLRAARSSLLPLPGWDPAAEWRGYVPFARLPHRFNPPEGFIAMANNKLVDDSYPYRISDLWEPSSRIERLNTVLGRTGDRFALQDFEWLQNDAYSYYAREIVPFIREAFADSGAGFPGSTRVFEYFNNWNFQFAKEDIATSILQMFLVRLVRNVYADEMGEDLLHDWVMLSNIPLRVTAKLLREGTSPWFDDVTTEAVETRDVIIRRSLREAMEELDHRFGSDTKLWRWGELHTVVLEHPFGKRRPLDRVFNIGPFPVNGASTALVSGEYNFNDPFKVTVGPSFRQIFDFAGDGPVRSVLPSGQSGQAFHLHYDDQVQLWLNGGYRISSFSHPVSVGAAILTLTPRQ
ncbi:MAG: penicillin acylase family protein [Bacteroidota bacterium]